jgi:hypothetical protein
MYFVVMPRVSLIVILVMYVRYFYSINCPAVICLPSMLYLSYGETPLVNCGPRSNFLYIVLPFYYYSLCLLSCILLSYYHSIRSFLCLQQTGEIDNLIISWEQSTCLCCVGFTLLLGEDTPTSSLSGALCYSVMVPEKKLLACSSKSLCVVNDQPVRNPKRKV